MTSDPIFRLTRTDIEARSESLRQPWHADYFAMYSSVYGGIVTEPILMQIPVDDHVAHRGDGVFETLKCVNGSIYALESHLDRLQASAEAIRLPQPVSRHRWVELIRSTVRAGGHRDALIRLILSRGPGGFGVHPRECPHPGIYIICYRLPPSFMCAHPAGARAARSRLPVKPIGWADIKTCNYLLNAMMAMEASRAGVDFVFGFDESGEMTESATENAGIVTKNGELLLPKPGRLLEGITMNRIAELARQDIASGLLKGVRRAGLREEDLFEAGEILIFGTTKDVTSVVFYEGRAVGSGFPGPIQQRLQVRLQEDIHSNSALRTACFD